MVTLKYENLLSNDYMRALKAVMDAPSVKFSEVKDAYKAIRIAKAVTKEYESLNKLNRELLEKYAARKEDGSMEELMVDEKPTGKVKIKEEESEEYNKKFSELKEISFDIKINKFSENVIKELGLSAIQSMLLEDLIEMPELEDEEAVVPEVVTPLNTEHQGPIC